MTESVHLLLVQFEMGLAVVTALALVFVAAPYGRHTRKGWGPTLPTRLAWVLMEAPASLVFLGAFVARQPHGAIVPATLLVLWQIHYAYRAFVYPARIQPRPGSRTPWLIVALAVVFNVLNGTVNGWQAADVARYTERWLLHPAFLAGATLFFAGLVINRWSDAVLARLRAESGGYGVPHGGLYRYVSCPNYLGECLQWLGWAVATWSLAGLAFFLYSLANLVPRAVANHRWYRERFPDYPGERRAFLPFVL